MPKTATKTSTTANTSRKATKASKSSTSAIPTVPAIHPLPCSHNKHADKSTTAATTSTNKSANTIPPKKPPKKKTRWVALNFLGPTKPATSSTTATATISKAPGAAAKSSISGLNSEPNVNAWTTGRITAVYAHEHKKAVVIIASREEDSGVVGKKVVEKAVRVETKVNVKVIGDEGKGGVEAGWRKVERKGSKGRRARGVDVKGGKE